MKGIEVNENLIFDLTSDYAKKYDSIPETNKQAIQWAYEKGREQSITEFAEKLKRMCDSMISEEHNYHAQPTSWASAYEEFKEDIDELATELKGE